MTLTIIIRIATILSMISAVIFFVGRIGVLKGQYEERHKNHCAEIIRAHEKIEELEKRQNDQSGLIGKIETGIEYISKAVDEIKHKLDKE